MSLYQNGGFGIPAQKFWASVSYHEFNVTVGDVFKVPRECSSFIVDGYFNTDNHLFRYSLGQFTNIHRTSLVERTRMYIGRGVEISKVNENDINLHCRSLESVFVESDYLDSNSNKENGPFVHKIYHDAVVKILDLNECFLKTKKIVEEFLAANSYDEGSNRSGIEIRSLFTKMTQISQIR